MMWEVTVLCGVDVGEPGGSQHSPMFGERIMDPYNAATRHSVRDNITAHAGGGQTDGLQLLAEHQVNRVTTVASGNDSVKLPVAVAGLELVIINAGGGNSINVYPASGEQINAAGANGAFALASTKVAKFYATGTGQWHTQLTA